MDINIYVNEKKINPLYMSAVSEYIKRLSPYCRLHIVCAPGKIKFRSSRNSRAFVIKPQASDSGQMSMSSEEYAAGIEHLTTNGVSSISYYVGYDDCDDMDSLCICTLHSPADMTALMLSEQIYRAYTIMNNITYHK